MVPGEHTLRHSDTARSTAGGHELEHLAELVESAHDAIVGMDPMGRITSWNRGAVETYGFTREEALGRSNELIVPDDAIDEYRQLVARVAQGEWVKSLETVRRRQDGRRIRVRLTLSPVREPSGRLVGISSIASDVTERRLAEERFRVAVESSPSAMLLVDRAGKIVFANERTGELLGYEREALIGQNVDSFVPDDIRPLIAELRQSDRVDPKARLLGTGGDPVAVRKDGSVIAVEIALSPVGTEEGSFVLVSILDISERKRT